MGNTFIEFVELVSYCANKCRITSKDLCTAVALHLNKMAGDFRQVSCLHFLQIYLYHSWSCMHSLRACVWMTIFCCMNAQQVLEPLNLILRLYATGLNFTGCNIQSSGSDSITSKSADDESAFEILLDDGDELQHLATSIGLLDNYFHINSKENKVSFSAEHKVTVGQICSHMESDYEASMAFAQKNGKAYLLLYLNALKFLCQPLAELVNLERVQIIAESEAISSSAKLCHIQNALHQFCDVFLFCHW